MSTNTEVSQTAYDGMRMRAGVRAGASARHRDREGDDGDDAGETDLLREDPDAEGAGELQDDGARHVGDPPRQRSEQLRERDTRERLPSSASTMARRERVQRCRAIATPTATR